VDDSLVTQPDGTRAPELERDGAPLWRQIVQRLRREIEAGQHQPGARLPTEAALAARFAVNRHTVRRALDDLSQRGLVRVEQGRGMFVTEDVLDYAVEPRTRFSAWVRKNDMEPSGQVLRLLEAEGEPRVLAGLGLPARGRVILLERLGLADGRPVSLTRHYFPAARLPGLLDALRADPAGNPTENPSGNPQGNPSITEALRTAGVADYRRQVTRVTARPPTAIEAMLLRMARGRPVLATENVNVDPNGAVVEFALGCYPTPRVQIVFEP